MNQQKQLPVVQGPCVTPLETARLCKICRAGKELQGVRRCSRIVAESPAMRAVLARVSAIAAADASVVIHGETGTGKEVVARLIHANSRRSNKPFVALNVAAMAPELLESELFGHVRGAFTGAVSTTRGVFGEAHEGTLFLDELGEMPLPLQAKLLRAVQEGEVRRVGDAKTSSVDVRILCATHRDLREEVRAGRFREDLYYRLKVLGVTVPPLRERPEDVLPLTRALAARLDARIELKGEVRALFLKYSWPGNVRELGNAVEHALALGRGEEVGLQHLPEELLERPAVRGRATNQAFRPLADVEREHILSVLEACQDNQLEAAQRLGIGRSTLWRKLREYGREDARAQRSART